VAPEVGALVAGGAGGEGGVEARGALFAEDPCDPDTAQALPGVRVARGPVGALQVTVTCCGSDTCGIMYIVFFVFPSLYFMIIRL